MARKGSVAASSIKRGAGNGGKRVQTGGQGKGGNASIKRTSGGSKRIDQTVVKTGSNIKPSKSRGYDQGMHTGKGQKAQVGKAQLG